MASVRPLLTKATSAAVAPALALLLVAGCGGDDATGPGDDSAAPGVSISSPADGATFVEGSTVVFEGTAEDDEDGTLSGDAYTWESDRDGELNTGPTFATDALSVGTHTITLTATDDAGDSGSASIDITVEQNDPPSASIGSPPDDTVYGEGAPVDLEGSATDPQSGDLTGSALTWSSDQDGTIGTGEQVTTFDLSVATHAIELVAEDPQGLADTVAVSITVEENGQPTATIDAPSDGAAFEEGQTVTFEGSGSDPEDGQLTGSSLEWTSDIDGELGTGETVTRDDLTAGTHTIVLTATDSRSAPASDTIEIDVNGDPEASIAQPSAESTFDEGDAVTLEGTATDPTEGSLSGASLEWSSDRDGTLGTGGTVTTSSLSGGPHTVTLTATDSDGNTGSASVRILVESPGFDIRLRFVDDFSGSEQATIEDALGPWLEAITGDLQAGFPPDPDPDFPESVNDCLADLGGIDDLAVCVFVEDIDGEGQILAQAAPILFRDSGTGLPSAGVVFVDDADRDNPQLEQIATHEVGHVLGIGTADGWDANANTSDPVDPFFTGTNALNAFEDDLDGQAYLSDGVPLANTGGQGTAGAHWRERNFTTELMTGTIDPVDMPLSVVSLAALEDFGYEVDLATADPFSLPMPQLALWEAEADATLSQPASAAANFGDGAVVVGSNNDQMWTADPESEVFTGLIRFDVPGLPSGVGITGATLTFSVQAIDDETIGHDVEVSRVTGSWSEGTVTWDTRPDFASSPLLSYAFDRVDPAVTSSDFTSLVSGWSDGSTPNHGLALEAPDADSDPTFSVGYWSRDAATADNRPRIEVEASTAAGIRAPDAGVRREEGVPLGDDIWRGPRIEVTPDGTIVRILKGHQEQ